jgi:hypothetical protein
MQSLDILDHVGAFQLALCSGVDENLGPLIAEENCNISSE